MFMMPRLLRPWFLALSLLLVGSTLWAARTFPHEGSDLPPDPAARFGTLENGMQYIILPNPEPKGRLALRLVVEVGAFMETESQRGLAHFLEHMAFNGTTHYPPGEIIKFFQRMGMGFGNDTNAYTSFDHTVYMLDLPDTKDETLAEGFQVFADYAGGMLLLDEELEAERGIILAEKVTRDTVGFRTFVTEAGFVYPQTLIPVRMPIGIEAVISGAGRDEFVDYYDTWYRPERMTVIAVGDADPDVLEQKLTAALAGLQPRGPARPDPELGTLDPFTGVRVNYHHEPESPATTISLQTAIEHVPAPDSAAKRLQQLPRDLAVAMLNRRLAILAKEENAGFTSARTFAGESFRFMRETSIEVTAKPDQWRNAVRVADHELRRALTHGFQATELREVVANFRNGLEQAVKTAATRRSPQLASQLISSQMNRGVFTTPAQNLALYEPALTAVTVEDCHAALRDVWADHGRYLLVSGNLVLEGDAHAAIAAAYGAAQAEPVAPPALIADEDFAYTDFGPAGKVVAQTTVEDLGINLVTFANGVRLNLKPTDFEANRIHLSVRVGTGQLTEPRDQPGLAYAANNTFIAGGLGRHSADDLRRILAGRTVGVGFGVGEDAFQLNGSTNRDDLRLELQLVAAHLTDPGYRPEAMRQFHKGMEQMFKTFAHTPNGAMSTKVPRLLSGDDPRFGVAPESDLKARTLDEIRAWLTPELTQGALEIAIIGDFEIDAAIAAVAQTLGALPARATKPELAAQRELNLPDTPFDHTFTFTSEIPKGVVALYWRTTDSRDVHLARRLSLLGSVLTERLRVKVREEIGGAYSPGAGHTASEVYPGYGWMRAFITVEPGKAELLQKATIELADDLANNGVTADELERVRLPILTSLRESVRTNGYWLGSVLSRAQEKPQVLDWSRTRTEDFSTITKEELDALARQYLGRDRVFRVTVLPAQK
jgi:zinc protease